MLWIEENVDLAALEDDARDEQDSGASFREPAAIAEAAAGEEIFAGPAFQIAGGAGLGGKVVGDVNLDGASK
ncbi:MAG TPA: hypothetical protein VH250_10685 [Granulicella sp.]|nr:hypothetical protein [Granulicella sp.]